MNSGSGIWIFPIQDPGYRSATLLAGTVGTLHCTSNLQDYRYMKIQNRTLILFKVQLWFLLFSLTLIRTFFLSWFASFSSLTNAVAGNFPSSSSASFIISPLTHSRYKTRHVVLKLLSSTLLSFGKIHLLLHGILFSVVLSQEMERSWAKKDR